MEYEKQGYAELYEISDENMEEICESNGYYFLENGEYYVIVKDQKVKFTVID